MKNGSFRWNTLLLLIVLLVSGCEGLILRDTDSTAQATGKVTARVLLCPLTFCFSELGVIEAKNQERRAEEQTRYRQWFQTLTPEQQERELDRQARLDAARMQALGLMMQGRGLFQQPPAPMYTPPPPISTPRTRHCTSNIIGNQVYTDCY